MGARGMARNVEPVRVAAELLRVAMDPGDCATYLLGHHGQVAAEILHGGEIQDDEVGAGAHERFRGKSVVLREPAAPGSTVQEHVYRCVRARGCKNIEPLDGRGAVGVAPRRPDPRAGDFAVGRIAPGDLRLVGRVDALVVGVVELLLVQVEPHARPSRARRLLGERGTGSDDRCAGRSDFEEFPSRDAARILFPAHLFTIRSQDSGAGWAATCRSCGLPWEARTYWDRRPSRPCWYFCNRSAPS